MRARVVIGWVSDFVQNPSRIRIHILTVPFRTHSRVTVDGYHLKTAPRSLLTRLSALSVYSCLTGESLLGTSNARGCIICMYVVRQPSFPSSQSSLDDEHRMQGKPIILRRRPREVADVSRQPATGLVSLVSLMQPFVLGGLRACMRRATDRRIVWISLYPTSARTIVVLGNRAVGSDRECRWSQSQEAKDRLAVS